ncbi:CARDB domain-containing protein [Halosolutus halophilus]|uniref:CARDB domain-containing protein n=1 Tax=Halosolutus halophilus TaxID=1552990 RepID=UPI0022351ECD|nr:CARDB domain-containing protein [Halosolutus halophilus]
MFATIAIVIAVVVGSTVAVATVGAAPAQQGSDKYSVIQGDQCITIEPLGFAHQSAEEFYDYRTPDTDPSSPTYSSHGTRNLQEDDTSIVFLHESRDGLSLGFVHDRTNGNSSGGAATFQISGLPEDGEWVIEDDNYDGADDEFDHRNETSRISWVWAQNRSDGAVFNGGLEDDFAIEVFPMFNDEADFRVYDGEISDWEVISGPPNDRKRTSLDMREPIVIQSGGCDSFGVTELNVEDSASAGEPVEIEAVAENNGESTVTTTVEFTVNDESVDRQDVTLEPGETTTVKTTTEFNESGTYTVGAGEQSKEVTVGDESLPGFGVTAAALAALLVALVARYRL